MDFTQSSWFMWVCIVIIACSIFTIFWTSFVEESDIDWRDAGIIALKVVLYVPMLMIGALLIAIQKRYWGAIVFAVVIIIMFIVAFIHDPGGSPAPW